MTQKPQAVARDPGTQLERFKEAARNLGCDEDETAFDDKLRQIARYKPHPKAPKVPKAPKAKASA